MNPRQLASRALSLLTLLAFVATACGSGTSVLTDEERVAALTTASETQSNLTISDDLTTTEMLDVRTGEKTTLAEQVDGDRAVVVWYWAPH